MTCRELAEFLQDYFADELPSEVATSFTAHLDRCGDCVVFLEQYRKTISVGHVVRKEEIGEVPDDLIQAILDSVKQAAKD
jgi:hypothetical protein